MKRYRVPMDFLIKLVRVKPKAMKKLPNSVFDYSVVGTNDRGAEVFLNQSALFAELRVTIAHHRNRFVPANTKISLIRAIEGIKGLNEFTSQTQVRMAYSKSLRPSFP